MARGGPDGGDGGAGGDVYLEASRDVVSLLAFEHHPFRRAEDGGHGGPKRRHGRRGTDVVVTVPEGTVVRVPDAGTGDRDPGEVLADLATEGDRCLVAAGGRGGRGNASFATNQLRAPAFGEQGELGEERWLGLELKLFADVALVGFPNVGKSTLIARISAARPKIADYPFTTLTPNLGVVRVGGRPVRSDLEGPASGTELIVADIPGLIEGASEGRGLGHEFLRHIERARVLALCIDLAPQPLAPATPAEQVATLLHELERYEPELLSRPRLVVGVRADLVVERDRPPCSSYGGTHVVSAVTGEGLAELLASMASAVTKQRSRSPRLRTLPVVRRPLPDGVEVVRNDAVFVVKGRAAERAVALSDLTNAAALAEVERRLRRLGVDRALRRAGARPGDRVEIGSMHFDYESDR